MTPSFSRRHLIRIAAGGSLATAAMPLAGGVNANVIGAPVEAGRSTWLNAADAGSVDTGVGWPAGTVVRVTSDVLRLRSGPGIEASIIAAYNAGADGEVLAGPRRADGYQWYRVEMFVDGNVGWMADAYLEIARYEPTGSRLRVVDGPLNLREWSSLGAPVITTIPEGDVVVIADASSGVADGYNWWYVSLEEDPDVLGWIAFGFTEPLNAEQRPEPTGARLRVVDGPLRLREGGGLSYDVITTIPEGDVVVVVDASIGVADGYNWWHVSLAEAPEVRGWIAFGFTEEVA